MMTIHGRNKLICATAKRLERAREECVCLRLLRCGRKTWEDFGARLENSVVWLDLTLPAKMLLIYLQQGSEVVNFVLLDDSATGFVMD